MKSADEALKRLLDGNKRFAAGRMRHDGLSTERRVEVLKGQQPFAVVLGCSDSRVPPEILFDRGLGDLFVVRTAGHVLDKIALESIEYAVTHLETPLIMVLAHSGCGAVTAAVSQRDAPPENANRLIMEILPAVEEAASSPGSLVNAASKIHARRTAETLTSTFPEPDDSKGTSRLSVVPAYYNLETGLVEILSGRPEQDAAEAT